MKKGIIILFGAIVALYTIGLISSYSSTYPMTSNRSGVQLYIENYIKCHKDPPLFAFNYSESGIVVTDIRTRTKLKEFEANKIIECL